MALTLRITAEEVPRVDLLVHIEQVIALSVGNDHVADALEFLKIFTTRERKNSGSSNSGS